MTRFRWHVDYFDDRAAGACVRREIIEADNADQAEKRARTQIGPCKRVEVRRVATTAPIRIVYASEQPRANSLSAREIVSSLATRAFEENRSLSVASKGSPA